MTARAAVLVLGGGVGGVSVANRLARAARDRAVVTVLDSHEDHLHQTGLLHVALGGGRRPEPPRRALRSLLHPRVKLRTARALALDPARRYVELESRERIAWDLLVVATGARNDKRAVPGYAESALHFHCRRRAAALREAVLRFSGGRIVVGAARLPYRCPPSPHEFALLLEEHLRRERPDVRARTQIAFVYPSARAFPSAPGADVLEPILRERGIEAIAPFTVESIDPDARVARSREGVAVPFDLLVMVPPHRGDAMLVEAGLGDADGWLHPDQATLRVSERVFALGDAAALPVPKTGSAARRQASAVAEGVLAAIDDREPALVYDGGMT